MKVLICIGSSCHLKGSYDVIEKMKQALKEHGLEERVELGASFCLGNCKQGVSVKVDDTLIGGFMPDTFDALFEEHILKALEP